MIFAGLIFAGIVLRAQAVKLRDVALDVLASAACNLPTPSLATRDVRAQPGYQLLDGDVRARLDALTAFHDEVHSLITFAMYDQISVLVFMAVYILREKRPVRTTTSSAARPAR